MYNDNTVVKITLKGAMLLALCDTFGSDFITHEQVDKCYNTFIKYSGIEGEENDAIL